MGKHHSKNLKSLEKQIIYKESLLIKNEQSFIQNNISFCDICDIINLNKYMIKHCILCNTCHIKYKLFCSLCKQCYNPFLDSEFLLHKKQCKKIIK